MQGLNARELRSQATWFSSWKLSSHSVSNNAYLLPFQMPFQQTPPLYLPALSLIHFRFSSMSQRSSPFPNPHIKSTHIDSGHICNQRIRIRRQSEGPRLQFIQAAKLEIPCLGAVVFKFFLSLCCQTASSYFHFCYWGVRKQKYLMIRHLAPQSTHLSSLFQTWDGLSLLRIFP